MKHKLAYSILIACASFLVCYTNSYSQPQPLAADDLKIYNSGMDFTCITVDARNNIWAGTKKQGLYLLNQAQTPQPSQFTILNVDAGGSPLAGFEIQALAADGLGNVWVGHAGLGTTMSSGGGLEQIDINTLSNLRHYVPNRDAECFTLIERDGIGTLNVKSLAVDENNTVWSAHRYHSLTSGSDFILTPGTLSYKRFSDPIFLSKSTYDAYKRGAESPELPYPAYTCNPKVSETPQSRTCPAVSCNSKEVWVSVFPYVAKNGASLPARVLRYGLEGEFIGILDANTIGMPAGFGVFNGIYLSPKKTAWLTVSARNTFAVQKNGVWNIMNSASCMIPAGASFNDNAIWGNKFGNVFIGTTRGLLVYDGRGSVAQPSSYTFYSTANVAFVSDNIKGGYSEKDSIQWIATDKGIMRIVLGRFSIDDVDYTSCGNANIDFVETSLSDPATKKDASYHNYRLETVICDQTGPNGQLCNAETIYKLMKDSVVLTAPTPHDFPYDNLTPQLLVSLTKADLQTTVSNVNAWKPVPSSFDGFGRIRLMASVIPPLQLTNLVPYGLPLPFWNNNLRNSLQTLQKALNPANSAQCEEYQLYNSDNFITRRLIFRLTAEEFCSGRLENVEYDRIFMFIDDKNYTIVNYTKEGHFLWPGKVTRMVVEDCGQVKVVTIGEGTQFCGDNLLGEANATGNMVVGSILFKNIDLRLKKAFENLK